MTPEPRKHDWKRDETGSIDYIEMGDHHGGPQCAACGECFCQHCERDRWDAVEAGADPADCVDWHDCPEPPITSLADTWTCPEPACGKTYHVRAYWTEVTPCADAEESR